MCLLSTMCWVYAYIVRSEGSIHSVFTEGTVVLILFKTLCAVLIATRSAYFSSLYSSAGQLWPAVGWTSGLKGLSSLRLHVLESVHVSMCFGISPVWWPLLGWLNSSTSTSVQVLWPILHSSCSYTSSREEGSLPPMLPPTCWLGSIVGQARVAASDWGCTQVVPTAATPQCVCVQQVQKLLHCPVNLFVTCSDTNLENLVCQNAVV